jgi:hypothetical protein
MSASVVVALALARLASERPAVGRAAIAATACGLLLAAPGCGRAWGRGLFAIRSHDAALRRGAGCLRHCEWASDDCLLRICWNADLVRRGCPRLRRLRLGPFATLTAEPPLSAYVVSQAPHPPGRIDTASWGGRRSRDVMLTGRVSDPYGGSGGTVEAILVAVDGRIVGRAAPGTRPSDPAGEVRADVPGSSWEFAFTATRLAPRPHLVETYALLAGRRIVKLPGSVTVDRARGTLVRRHAP